MPLPSKLHPPARQELRVLVCGHNKLEVDELVRGRGRAPELVKARVEGGDEGAVGGLERRAGGWGGNIGGASLPGVKGGGGAYLLAGGGGLGGAGLLALGLVKGGGTEGHAFAGGRGASDHTGGGRPDLRGQEGLRGGGTLDRLAGFGGAGPGRGARRRHTLNGVPQSTPLLLKEDSATIIVIKGEEILEDVDTGLKLRTERSNQLVVFGFQG